MSETRDLGVPVVVLLAGLAVAAWGLSIGAPWPALVSAPVGALAAWSCLRLTVAKSPGRSLFLAIAALLGIAAFAPAFEGNRLAFAPWALGALGAALRARALPPRARVAFLAAAAVLSLLAVAGAFALVPALRAVAGFALAGAFVAAVNVVATRPVPAAEIPKGPVVGVFGGSFDPFHVGHRAICEAAVEAVQRLLVVVAARPPHKAQGREPSPFHHRVAMCRLGVEGLPRTEVLEMEARREGPSYTVDTLEALRRLYPPRTTFRLVLGADSLQDFPLWHDWEGILERADLLVAARPGSDREPPPEFEGRNAPITWLEAELVDASSTEIRRRVAVGEPTQGLLTPAVAAYVRDHALYREGERPAPDAATCGAVPPPPGPSVPPPAPPPQGAP